MAWNEPGNGQDPWKGGRRGGGSDLDRLLADLQRRLRRLFGGGGAGGGGSLAQFAWIPLLLIGGWLLTGFYQVDAGERGVVKRFGAFEEITLPGLHWHLPWPIESREIVQVDFVRSHLYRSEMLTSDNNLISIAMEVQYRVQDGAEGVKNYVFNVRRPDETLADVADSALREVVGRYRLDDIVAGDTRQKVADETESIIQQVLNEYGAGIHVMLVNLTEVLLPQSVRSAVEDVNRAEADNARLINEAQAYANDIIPRARGQAARRIEEATAYRERVIAEAQGEAARFNQLLAEYRRAPEVTRKRLYLQTMERVLGGMPKVLVDVQSGDNLIYLPLDRYLQQQSQRGEPLPLDSALQGGSLEQQQQGGGGRQRDGRTREVR